MASQITSLTIVYSIVYSDADQRKHQSSASLAFVRGIHRGPVNSPHKGPVAQKLFPFDDVIMCTMKGRVKCTLGLWFDINLNSRWYEALIHSYAIVVMISRGRCADTACGALSLKPLWCHIRVLLEILRSQRSSRKKANLAWALPISQCWCYWSNWGQFQSMSVEFIDVLEARNLVSKEINIKAVSCVH